MRSKNERRHILLFSNPLGSETGMCTIPILFITYIDHICKVAKTTEENNLNDNLKELLFADDQALVASSKEQLQRQIDRLHQTCQTFIMKINIENTEVMKIGRTERNTYIYLY